MPARFPDMAQTRPRKARVMRVYQHPLSDFKEATMMVRKTYAALALAGALAVATATPSHADSRWGWAAGGFAAGALVGSAAAANANAGYYYGGPYAYEPGYAYAPSSSYGAYAYEPGYATTYSYTPRSYSYRPNRAPNFDPENGDDPDPRIGGSFKMNSSGDD
jgi:hypothetical protein